MLAQRISSLLSKSLVCERLEVINESHLHAGHKAFSPTNSDSHFRIIISSKSFKDLPLVQAHQKIYAILKAEMQIIHALAIEIV